MEAIDGATDFLRHDLDGAMRRLADQWIGLRPPNPDDPYALNEFVIAAENAWHDYVARWVEVNATSAPEWVSGFQIEGDWPLPYHMPPSGLACVYELYSGDELVYVGQTRHARKRLGRHRKTFQDRVDRWQLEIVENRDAALAIEKYRIATFNPRYNNVLGVRR